MASSGNRDPASSSIDRRLKCEKEISEWVKHVIRQVEIAGKDLLLEMEDMMHNKLELVGLNDDKSRSNCVATTKTINFVPNDKLEWSNLGFLAIDNVLPTDFQLDMATLLQNVQVGGKITCLLSCNKEVSKTVLNFLQCSVIHNDKPVDVSMDSSQLKFEFSLHFNGEYHVTAQLYGQHVLGSPLTLPVAASALPGLLQLGLIPHGYGVGGGKSTELNLVEGSECVAKWTEDMVWYRARVDKVEGEMLEVTFLDYGNKEMVDNSHVVRTASNIPEGEDVDDFVTKLGDENSLLDRKHCMKLSIGEVVIAKWAEDNVWYNGEIIKLNVDDGKTAEVCFTDYGNTEEVEIMNIVKTKEEIPMKDDVDENVLETTMKSNDESVNDCLRVENTIKGDLDETKASDKCPQVGSTVVAKWLEDEVWYNAEVESITGEGYNVVFIDYGNSAIVKPEHILRSALDIPDNDCIDECVALGETESLVLDKSCRWSEGCTCIAQWSEDKVWYNAAVDRDLGSGQYEVTFTDYGNKAVVAADKIVASTSDIPQDQVEMIDECVNNNQNDVKEELKPELKTFVNTKCDDSLKHNATDESSQITIDKSNNPFDSESSPRSSSFSNLSGGSKCIACWSEDDVWYNAQIEKEEAPGVYVVTFTDYGNQETATADRIVLKVDEIPVDQRDMLDENVAVQTIVISDELVTQGKISAEVVSSEKQQVVKGESVIARWDEDGVWYNAVIENVAEDGRIEVTFTDYGNSAIVSREDMVSHAGDIPSDKTEMIDECVRIDKVPGENLVSHAKDIPDQTEMINESVRIQKVPGDEKSSETQLKQNGDAEKMKTIEGPFVVPLYNVGSLIIARWTEDDVWYNAVVEAIDETNGKVDVLFTDYGNATTVPSSNVVISAGEIPADQMEMIDECVIIPRDVSEAEKKDTKTVDNVDLVGKAVIARWSEDGVWYKALVDGVDASTGEVAVTFIDYGNTASVSVKHIVNTVDEIPVDEQDMIDHFVHQVCESDVKPTVLATIREEEDHPISSQCWTPGNLCLARWDEDNVWYNAEVLKDSGSKYLVRFVDYGNEAEVNMDAMVSKVNDIPTDDVIDECVDLGVDDNCKETAHDSTVPPSLQCSLCGGLCRRGMRLVCSTAGTCWGCAVKEINSTRICWKCGEKEISTESHLVKDMMLSSFVEEFVKTGKLDPVHVHALKNTILEAASQERDVEHVVNSDKTKHKVKTELPVSPTKNLSVGTKCIARWSDDNVWYNAVVEEVMPGSVRVVFTDYGNSDEVKNSSVLTNPAGLPYGAEVDPHVKVLLADEVSTPPVAAVEFLKIMKNVGLDGVGELEAKQIMAIQDLKGPVGLAMLTEKTLAVVCKGDNTVRRFSMEGKFCGLVKGQREFVKPTDILVLRSGNFVVRDELGIQMFGEKGNFLKNLGMEFINRFYGLAEDEHGRVVTINSNRCGVGVGGCGKLTAVGETDLLYIDTNTGSVVKRVELIDIVGDGKDKSACRFLMCVNRRLYIVDMGLDCVYVLFQKDGEEQADVFGSSGSNAGQLRDPAGLVVDSSDTIIIVDSKNNRLQLVDRDYTFCGTVKVDSPLSRPSGIFLSQEDRMIFVSNYAQQSVVCYQI